MEVASTQIWPNEEERATELSYFESFSESFCNSLDAASAQAMVAAQLRAKLVESKSFLREAEKNYVRALREKTRKEAGQVATKELISNTKSRIEEIRKKIELERTKRNKFLSSSLLLSHPIEEKRKKTTKRITEIADATKWYNNVLGFHIESGRGVKFSFTNVSQQDPTHQCSFTVRYENDTYTLLACDPHLECTKDLVLELNRTNGLYEFVRTMRQKFLEASLSGCNGIQESWNVSSSAPSDSSTKEERNTENKKSTNKKVAVSPSPVRFSSRLKAKK